MASGSKNDAQASDAESPQIAFDFLGAQDGAHAVPLLDHSYPTPFDCKRRFEELMSPQALKDVFQQKFRASTGKGIDRVNGFQFEQERITDLIHASRKCLDGSFRFTPYLEVLKSKGRNSKPRLISIPTVRDRVVLHQLKDLLAEAFPDSVPRSIAGALIREIAADLPNQNVDSTYAAGCDIRQFYDSLHRNRLLKYLKRMITDERALQLIHHSIVTPTVPVSTRRQDYRKFTSEEGIPQGLATSNILAAIYVREIDQAMKKLPVRYYRYVDDVLIYGPHADVVAAQKSFVLRARRRGLAVHRIGGGKSHLTKLSEEFRYLGYVFRVPSVSVRPSSIENLLQSLAAQFSDFRHNTARRLERFKYLTAERLKDIFLLELNERITGAIKDNRRYGWIAYFSQITDLSLLHRLDFVLRGMFRRSPEFEHCLPPGLKSFSRAYFEMKFRPQAGYVRNFNSIVTRTEKLRFLDERGRVGPEEALTDAQIDARFGRYVNRVLRVMQADEARIY